MTDDDVHRTEMPDDLDALLHDLRGAADAVPPPAPGPALTTLFRDGAPAVAPTAPARRRAVGVAVAATVAGLGFGGLGVAGALPAPVQDRVADLVEPVGIDLPHSDDGDPDPVVTTTTSTTTTSTSTTTTAPTRPTPSATAPGQTGETPGRSDEAPGHRGSTPTPGGPPTESPAVTVPRRQDIARARRNPIAGADVHSADRPGQRPADDGGPLQ